MAKPRELRRRIKSIQSTRKITKTMELVATSKLKRAQERVVAARPYANALAGVIADLYAPELAERFPLLRQPHAPGLAPGVSSRVALILITANRGLCGAFNANLIREARRRIDQLEAEGAVVDLHLIGKKGITYFKFAKRSVASQRTDIGDKPRPEHAAEIMGPLMAQFESGAVDGVEVVFAQFKSAVSTPPTTLRILPITPPRSDGRIVGLSDGAGRGQSDHPTVRPPVAFYILKPSADAILEQLLPLYVRNQVFRALVETAAAFLGAQRTAMKNATDNAGEILDVLRRTYNRARQAQITQELAEIVGGAEALKG
ncbi:MAG TPA: ATP synthase F1 subunit gamma [Gemmatimonadales bacterium]|nr:ATP synthase F1 subunit gamma [Gemmatimonadales bacterium]